MPPCMLVEAGGQLCEGGSHLPSMWAPATEFKSSDFAANTFYLWSYHKRFLLWKPHLCVCVHMCMHTCRYIWRSEVRCPSLGAIHPHKAVSGLELVPSR